MKLEAFNKEYILELFKLNYVNNNRTYFGLIDKKDWWPFCDLSENHPEIKDSEIFWRLPGHEAIIIDNDFMMCFDSVREAKLWIKDNIKECVITGEIDGRDCFYIKKE
jgi:hypothetical protein